MVDSPNFWNYLDNLVASHQVIIDRPKGSRHPNFPEMVYPLDYGYLAGTTSGDGVGIDLWLGSLVPPRLEAILLTVDLFKRDLEINLLLGCTESEQALALAASSQGMQAAQLISRG